MATNVEKEMDQMMKMIKIDWEALLKQFKEYLAIEGSNGTWRLSEGNQTIFETIACKLIGFLMLVHIT